MIGLIGGTVIVIGVLMIVLPGPAFIVIPAGLAILGLEFAWARRWLKQLRTTGTQVFGATVSRWFRKHPEDLHDHRRERRYKHGAEYRFHAAPPYARGSVMLGRNRGATAAHVETRRAHHR
jgi:Putative transmembrane protein (PGPGW)